MASNLVQSPNGICYDQANNRLVFVNWGSNAPIKALSLSDSLVLTLATTNLGNCDGIVWNGLDTWYVSVWTGQKVMKFDANFAAGPILVANALGSPADIDYNLEGDTLAIPNSGNNTLTFIGLPSIVNVNCNLLPLAVLENEITFDSSQLSFGNSVIRVPLLNSSGLGFAYPLARLRVQDNLPQGMEFGNNQSGFNVFASAWNPDSVAVAEIYFNVNEPIPTNTLLSFELDVTNLSPSSADTCFFTQTFTVNLNPDVPLVADLMRNNEPFVYPNPCSNNAYIVLPESANAWKIKLYSSTGQCLQTFESTGSTLIDMVNLKPGIYFLQANGNGSSLQSKLLKN